MIHLFWPFSVFWPLSVFSLSFLYKVQNSYLHCSITYYYNRRMIMNQEGIYMDSGH